MSGERETKSQEPFAPDIRREYEPPEIVNESPDATPPP